jgi:GT2 family glycosyltransferase
MEISVIIVTFNSSPYIEACLGSLVERMKGVDYELIIVDNASKDETCRLIRLKFPQVALIESQANIGFAGANNMGLRRAKGDFILLINPDTYWKRGEMGKALRFLREHPGIGGLGARLILKDGSWQKSHGNFPTLFRELKEALYLPRFFSRSKWFKGMFIYREKREPTPVDWVSCTFFLGRRNVMAEAGFFDERYFMYYEDIDLSKGIRERGKELYYYPEIEFLHFQRSPRIYDYGKSPYLYFHKHFGLPFAKILRWVLVLKSLLRVVIFSMLTFLTRQEVFREKRSLNGRSFKFHLFHAGQVLKELSNGFKRSPDKNCHS